MWPVLLIGVVFPRLAAVVLYFFTDWFNAVFTTWYWPLLGFVFAPYTMLWFSVVMQWYGGVWSNLQLVVLAIAILADLSSSGKTARG